ncbi:YceI family protein [Mycolicibacterium mengxianglii]|uniref:YceI family protein n=1 Tax=Mycolicibacterium mengxianglii TaxID=2736649 RepID=UPI001E5C547B|nr:YceI family protein [Mycolicibacterium mengxianglii]
MSALENLLSQPGDQAVWTLAPQRCEITFRCRSFWGLLPVRGRFTAVRGDGQVAGGTAFGRVDIDAGSLTTGNAKRDEHLRSEDFFAVERFPTISVVVTAVEPAPEGAQVRAALTVRDVTHPLPLTATVTVLDDEALQIEARGTIDRTHWDVSGNLLGMVRRPTELVARTVFVKTG